MVVISSSGTGTLAARTVAVEIDYDRAIIGTQFKLIAAGQGGSANKLATTGVKAHYPAWGVAEQLYDLTADGAEQTNVAAVHAWGWACACHSASKRTIS